VARFDSICHPKRSLSILSNEDAPLGGSPLPVQRNCLQRSQVSNNACNFYRCRTMLVIFTSAVSASVLSTLRFCFCVLHGVCSGTNSRSLTSVRHATVCNRMRAPRATAKIALQQTASSLVRLSAAGVKLYHDRSIYLPLVTVFIILSHLS